MYNRVHAVCPIETMVYETAQVLFRAECMEDLLLPDLCPLNTQETKGDKNAVTVRFYGTEVLTNLKVGTKFHAKFTTL